MFLSFFIIDTFFLALKWCLEEGLPFPIFLNSPLIIDYLIFSLTELSFSAVLGSFEMIELILLMMSSWSWCFTCLKLLVIGFNIPV